MGIHLPRALPWAKLLRPFQGNAVKDFHNTVKDFHNTVKDFHSVICGILEVIGFWFFVPRPRPSHIAYFERKKSFTALPFRANDSLGIHPPRALPWAKFLRPFQGKDKKRNFKTCASGCVLTAREMSVSGHPLTLTTGVAGAYWQPCPVDSLPERSTSVGRVS